MRSIRMIAAIALLTLAGCAATAEPDSPEQLLQRLTEALAGDDPAALIELWHWDGVDPDRLEMMKTTIGQQFELCGGYPRGIVDVDPSAQLVKQGGMTFRPNLRVEGKVDFVCPSDSEEPRGFGVAFGNLDGNYYFVNVIAEPGEPETP